MRRAAQGARLARGQRSRPGRGPLGGGALQVGRPAAQLVDDGVDFLARRADPVADAVGEAQAHPGLARLGRLPRGIEIHALRRQALALPSQRLALALERAELVVHPGQPLRQLRLARALAVPRGLDDLRRDAQPGGDLERQAAPGRPVREPVVRREGVRVEAERRAGNARGGGRVRLEQLVVRRGHDHGAARAEVLDERRTQRAALHRVRARADLVEQDERGQLQVLVHRHDVADVAGEGGDAGRDRLLVSDVREDRAKHGHPRPRRRRHVQPGLRHEGQQPRRLQRHRLAARVRSGDDQHRGRGDRAHVHRRGLPRRRVVGAQPRAHLRNQQRMPRVPELEMQLGAQLRRDACDQARERGARLNLVDLRGGREGMAQVEGALAQRVGQLEEDPLHLGRLAVAEGDDVVVDLDGAERLEKQARPAARAAVDDARDRVAVLGLDHQHLPAGAFRHDALLQIARRALAPQVGVERGPQPVRLPAQLLADRSQGLRGVVHHAARVVDLRADLRDLAGERAAPLQRGPQRRKRPAVRALDRAPDGVHGREKRGQAAQVTGLERESLDREARQGLLEIRRRVEPDRPVRLEIPNALAGGCQGGLRAPDVGARAELGQPGGAERCQREALNNLDDPVELEGPERAVVHDRRPETITDDEPWSNRVRADD